MQLNRVRLITSAGGEAWRLQRTNPVHVQDDDDLFLVVTAWVPIRTRCFVHVDSPFLLCHLGVARSPPCSLLVPVVVVVLVVVLCAWSKKNKTIFGHNFGKCRPISKILSLIDFQRNCPYLWYRLPSHLNCVATLPCEIRKFKITYEFFLLPSLLICFTWNFGTQYGKLALTLWTIQVWKPACRRRIYTRKAGIPPTYIYHH